MQEKSPQSTYTPEAASNELPARDEAIDAVRSEIEAIRAKLTDAEAKVETPGFRASATDLVENRGNLRDLRNTDGVRLEQLEALWASAGGNEIDAAQSEVDGLNFKSDATDHVTAKARLRDAKNAFYENMQNIMQSEDATEPASPDVEQPVVASKVEVTQPEVSVEQPVNVNVSSTEPSVEQPAVPTATDNDPSAKPLPSTDEIVQALNGTTEDSRANRLPSEDEIRRTLAEAAKRPSSESTGSVTDSGRLPSEGDIRRSLDAAAGQSKVADEPKPTRIIPPMTPKPAKPSLFGRLKSQFGRKPKAAPLTRDQQAEADAKANRSVVWKLENNKVDINKMTGANYEADAPKEKRMKRLRKLGSHIVRITNADWGAGKREERLASMRSATVTDINRTDQQTADNSQQKAA